MIQLCSARNERRRLAAALDEAEIDLHHGLRKVEPTAAATSALSCATGDNDGEREDVPGRGPDDTGPRGTKCTRRNIYVARRSPRRIRMTRKEGKVRTTTEMLKKCPCSHQLQRTVLSLTFCQQPQACYTSDAHVQKVTAQELVRGVALSPLSDRILCCWMNVGRVTGW